jgi:hypothetical protein
MYCACSSPSFACSSPSLLVPVLLLLILVLLLFVLVLLGPAGELVHGTVEAESLAQPHEGRGGHHGLNNSEQILHKIRIILN